ncbi:MAG: hypothetical protein ACTILB_15295 [Brevibacterium aurantiacum]|uniref:hypothetical protein n=1 Tax=Microbacterium gubbeenense TaxID=159896 RepID=UPI0004107913|nr:hypothetical protein [Microbacterium gubbeenense]
MSERDDRPEWATVCHWIDAGRPDLSPEGEWLPIDGEAEQPSSKPLHGSCSS